MEDTDSLMRALVTLVTALERIADHVGVEDGWP
jgi:hypothetical protein